jgi:hypothetical protein
MWSMSRILKYKYKLLLSLTVVVFLCMVGIWVFTIFESQNSTQTIQGAFEGKVQIFEDEYLKVFNREKLQITEDKKAANQFGKDITKRWFYFYENENLKNGFEAYYIMDSTSSNNDELVAGISKYLGFDTATQDKVIGCNEEKFYRLNKSNVNPINYYMNVKGNRIFLLKHYDQLKQNKFYLNLSNFCLKN